MRYATILCISAVLLARARGKLVYKSHTFNYTTICAPGLSEFCYGSRNCTDGTQVYKPGYCSQFGDWCFDPASQPLCKINQYLQMDDFNAVPSGRGPCNKGPFQSFWARLNYTYTCYDCPKGFIAPAERNCWVNPRSYWDAYNYCIACSEPNEVLVGDYYYGYSCKPPHSPNEGHCKMVAEGISLVKGHEGSCTYFYEDTVQHKAIGYGHDCCAKNDCSKIAPQGVITHNEMDSLLYKDLAEYEHCVGILRGAETMNINQFSSFVDYAFARGCGNFTGRYHAEIVSKDWAAICTKFATLGPKSGGDPAGRAALCKKPTTVLSGCGPSKSKAVQNSTKRSAIDAELLAPHGRVSRADEEEVASTSCPASLKPHKNLTPVCKVWTGGKPNCVGSGCHKCQHVTDT